MLSFEDPWNLLSPLQTFLDVSRHRRDIVSQQDSPFGRREGKYGWILCAPESNILHPYNIQIGPAQQQATDDPVVEVLVGQMPELGEPHESFCSRRFRSLSRSPCVENFC